MADGGSIPSDKEEYDIPRTPMKRRISSNSEAESNTSQSSSSESPSNESSSTSQRSSSESPNNNPSASDNGSSSGSEKPKCLPSGTNLWSRSKLDIVRIYTQFKNLDGPLTLFEKSLKSLWSEEKYSKYRNLKERQGGNNTMFEDIRKNFLDLSDCLLNRKHIDEVTLIDIHEMKAPFHEWIKRSHEQSLTSDALEFWGNGWKYLMSAAVEKFFYQLEHMLLSKHRCGKYKEGMFQTLFLHFLEMFNLKAIGFSNIDQKSIKIKDRKISSTPDLLIMDFGNLTEEISAVVEVKKEYSKTDTSSGKWMRSSEKSLSYVDEVNHVTSELIGQHGGELLTHLPESIFPRKGIFGMIVQATKVTVTFLETEPGYLDAVKSFFEHEKSSGKITLSTECDILSKEERREFVAFLAELCFLQRLKKKNDHRDLFLSQ